VRSLPPHFLNHSHAPRHWQVLVQLYPQCSISGKGVAVMNSFVDDIFQRLAREASNLVQYNKARTMTARDVQTAARLVLRGDLASHAIAEGTKALAKYRASSSR